MKKSIELKFKELVHSAVDLRAEIDLAVQNQSLKDIGGSIVILDRIFNTLGDQLLRSIELIEYKPRLAKCMYCKNTSPVSVKLAWFKAQPDESMDEYDCLCRGTN